MKRRFYIGVDPGVSGAVAIFDPQADFMEVWDMPGEKSGNKDRHRASGRGLAGIFHEYGPQTLMALVEEVGSMPQQGVVSTFSFGFSTGVLHGVLHATYTPFKTITPVTWKNAMGVSADKNSSIRQAMRLFPEHGEWLTSVSKTRAHNRAEAMLLARLAAKDRRGPVSALDKFLL